MKRGDTTAALAEADSALRKFPSERTDWHWRFTVLKAEILAQQHQNKASLALIQPELPATLAESDAAVWRKLTQGADYSFLQNYVAAEAALRDAEKLARTNHPELLGQVALRKGTFWFLQGDFPAARSNYRIALDLSREFKDQFLEAAALGSLGLVSERMEHFDESLDWYQQALKVSESAGAMGSRSRIQGNMGWNHYVMGDFESALSLYEQAENESARQGLLGDQLHWLINIGTAESELHDSAAAEKIWEQALRLARSQDNRREVVRCLNNLSLMNLEAGQVESAERFNQEASNFEREGGDQYGALFSTLAKGRIELAKHEFDMAEMSFEKVLHDPAGDTPLRWEAQARLGQAFRGASKLAAAERQYQLAIETIDQARMAVGREEFRLSFLETAIEFYDEYVDFLMSQGRTTDALEVTELSRARTMAEGLGIRGGAPSFPMKGFEPTRTARRLNTVLLSYWLGPHHSYAWIVTPARVSSFSLASAGEINSLVQAYRKGLLGTRDPKETDNGDGKKLYEILVAPAKAMIPKGARVTILPDGSLYGLNFETLLVDGGPLHYWIEDVTIVNANSLVLLAASATEPATTKNLLLIGNTVAPNSEFPALPQAAAEMSRVESYFPSTSQTVLSGTNATPVSYFESKPGRFLYIHFVTHGTASRAKPLDSAVILSKAGESYKLYARDIINDRLHASLVTISACRGAGERTYSGEGLVGLAWAFLRAGAHGVIAALWEVSDNSTPQVMGQLYSGISQGESPEIALRNAKLALIHSGTVYRKPFYWAPFQMYRGS